MKATTTASIVVLLAGFTTLHGADDLHVYFGNLHSHTSYSDGSGYPAEAYAYARNKAHLDFLAITEHNHAAAEGAHKPGTPFSKEGTRKDGVLIGKDHSLYDGNNDTSVMGAARKANEDGKFVALYGQEFSTISSGNHVNVFEVGEVIPTMNGKFDKLLDWLATHNDSQGKFPILQFNHPVGTSDPHADVEYGRDDFGGDGSWVKKMGEHVRTIEVLCGPGTLPKAAKPTRFEPEYWDLLSKGFRVGPVGDQDNHFPTWGTLTDARTGVVCAHLTKKEILDAIRARHVYATEEAELNVIGTVNGHLCGDEFHKPAGGLDITVQISNTNDPHGDYTIEVYGGKIGQGRAAVVGKKSATGNGTVQVSGVSAVNYDYIAIKVTHEDDHEETRHAWLAPVWFN
ncbi:MAG: hypothetical protein JWR69_4621 [Pedosphaera sp.]|nr:hypothetical protein [Pedosphaera sp.]